MALSYDTDRSIYFETGNVATTPLCLFFSSIFMKITTKSQKVQKWSQKSPNFASKA